MAKSFLKNLFNSVMMRRPKRNVFDLGHDVKMSGNMGELLPCLCMECVPGDSLAIGCDSLIRLAPMVAPMMHLCNVSIHYFFVPNRLVWDNWEKWITGGGDDPVPGPIPAFPVFNSISPLGDVARLADYLGMPPADWTAAIEGEKVSAIPFAAYQFIVNEYYRDQNLMNKINYKLVDGDNTSNISALMAIRKRCWEHDYFTAALPFAQKGSPVQIPIGHGDVTLKDDWSDQGNPHFQHDGAPAVNKNVIQSKDVNDDEHIFINDLSDPGAYDPDHSLEVEIGATTINDLRTAEQLQKWLEKNARGGTRYTEFLQAHFGEKPMDARMQRPEYITGVKSPIRISEVLNTTGTEEAPQGNMAGHGVGVTTGTYGTYHVREHGYVIGILSVMPKTAYQQGIPRHFLKTNDPLEFYFPDFAHLGEQEVFNSEIMAYQTGADQRKTFGYVPRFAEYKFMPSRVAGEFRTTLNFWHMGRIFETPPALNASFVQADPTHRVFAVTDPASQKLWMHVFNKIRAVRPMPVYGTPQL